MKLKQAPELSVAHPQVPAIEWFAIIMGVN